MMILQSILLLSAILSTNLVLGNDPMARVELQSIEIKNYPNSYIENWSAEVLGKGDTLSVKMPIKKELPDTMMLKMNLRFLGMPFPEIDMNLCEAIEDETYAKPIVDSGLPAGEFPAKCPIKPNQAYEIFRYVITNENIIPGCPDGPFDIDIALYEPGKDPVATAHVEGQLLHTYPGLGGVPKAFGG